MKAALTKRLESLRRATCARSCATKNIRYGGVTREGQTRARALPRRRDARQGARGDRCDACPTSPSPSARTARTCCSSRTLKPEALKRTQEFALQAEHHHAAQPRQRARRRRAGHPAAGRRPHRGAAARRAGHGARPRTSSAAPRPWRCAWSTRSTMNARRARGGGARPAAVRHRALRRAQRPAGAGEEAGGAHRRPHQRRAARLRQPDQRARRCTSSSTAGRRASCARTSRARTCSKRMAILLFEKGKGEVVTAPVIQQRDLGGRFQITGRMTHARRPTTWRCCCAPARSPRRWRSSRSAPSARASARENIEKGFNVDDVGLRRDRASSCRSTTRCSA